MQDGDEEPGNRAAWMQRLDQVAILRESKTAERPIPEGPVPELPGPSETERAARPRAPEVQASRQPSFPGRALEYAAFSQAAAASADNAWSSAVESALVAVETRRAGTTEQDQP